MALALPAAAEPALWVVKDRDSTIYLFGTIHALKSETQWLSPKLEAAMAESTQLWLEIPIASRDDLRAAMAPLVKRYGLSKGAPLSSRLSPDEQKSFAEAVKRTGLPPHGLDMFQPWFAALGISTSAMTRAGYEASVEMKLGAMFAARGIAPKGIETPEDQVRIVAAQSEESQLAYLRSALQAHAGEETGRMVEIWSKGDVASLGEGIASLKAGNPDLHDRMFASRNARWAEQIETLLDGKSTVFVAVGAGHLVGPDSIQVQLARREITAERLS